MRIIIIFLIVLIMVSRTAHASFQYHYVEPVYYFVNHEKDLKKLRSELEQKKTIGITGMTGSGKSELARKYRKILNKEGQKIENKAAYSRFLGRVSRYEYFIENSKYDDVKHILDQAKVLIDSIPEEYGAKTAVYYEIFQIEIFSGRVDKAEKILADIIGMMNLDANLRHKESMLDYGEARIFLSKGEYELALKKIDSMLHKEEQQMGLI